MAEITIDSLEGGLSTVAPTAMLPNQCSYALNMEWFKSKCGERRLGTDAIDLDAGTLAAADRIVWMYRHVPSTGEKDAQFWVLAIDNTTPILKYKTTSWNAVSMGDALTVDGTAEFQIDAVTLHGKLFLFYNSSVDRLHVWDGTSLRRSGLATHAAAPTAANSGSGSMDEIRYYRTRSTVQAASITTRRSEPSAVLTHDPNGAATVTVTRPTAINEGETHWELEASFDESSWFVIATTAIATTTATDTTVDDDGYSLNFNPTAGSSGDYTVIPSARYGAVDDDRLLTVGSFEDEAQASRVRWTPTGRAEGVANDERTEILTFPYVDLDTGEGGPLTAISNNLNGYIYLGKRSAIYQAVRTSNRNRSYQFVALTKARGVEPGSMVEAVDNEGNPALYAIDRDVGPIRIGGTANGAETCGQDLVEVWRSYAASYTGSIETVQKGVYYPKKKQVQWIIPGSAIELVLHTEKMRRDEDGGIRGGWAFWNRGGGIRGYCNALFSDNIDANTTRSLSLVPFSGRETTASGLAWRHDTTNLDNGAAYTATLITKQYILGGLSQEFNIKSVTLYGVARTGASIGAVSINGLRANRVALSKSAGAVDFTPLTGESAAFHYEHGHGVRHIDKAGIAELHTMWLSFSDTSTPTAPWSLDMIRIVYDAEQRRQ